MGWSPLFGECLIECLEQVVASPEILLQEKFRRILSTAGKEWEYIVVLLNGGNDHSYNLHSFQGKAQDIEAYCQDPICSFTNKVKQIDWKRILEDVKRVSEIVRFEMRNNMISITPSGSQSEITDSSGRQRTYRHMEKGKVSVN